MDEKCPLCGTSGRSWHKDPVAFRCPNCFAIFSEFGLILESELEYPNFWS